MKRYDIGDNHWVGLAAGADAPDERVVALVIDHLDPKGSPHTGSLTLRQSDPKYHISGGVTIPLWDVVEPAPPEIWFPHMGIDGVTLTPSILCQCGDHGYIVSGRWEVSRGPIVS